MSPETDAEPAVDTLVKKTPWWAISTGLHVLGVLLLMFLVVAAKPADDVVIELTRTKPPPKPPVIDVDPIVTPVPIKASDPVKDPTVTPEREKENETPDDLVADQALGKPDAVAHQTFLAKSWNSSIGAGASASGRQGKGIGGRKFRRGHGPTGNQPPSERSLLAALIWLAKHQASDGLWGVQGHAAQCRGPKCASPDSASSDFDAGVTGLSVLAFLGAGYSHLSKDTYEGICFGEVVRKGLQALIARQDPEGMIGARTGHKDLYNHTIATLAVVEAYGLTGSTLFRDNAQRAVDSLLAAQNPGKGWRYSSRSGDNDTSVTGWAVMALKSAELSGIPFSRSAFDGARAWLDEVTEDAYGRAGYTSKGTGKVFCPHNAEFEHHEALTSIAVMCRIFMDRKADARVKSGAELIARELPEYGGAKTDYYAWYTAALALFQVDGPDGPVWSRWNRSMLEALVKPQNGAETGCRSGSWEPVDRWSCEGGRVYATALNALTLEVYYRYENVIGGKRGLKD